MTCNLLSSVESSSGWPSSSSSVPWALSPSTPKLTRLITSGRHFVFPLVFGGLNCRMPVWTSPRYPGVWCSHGKNLPHSGGQPAPRRRVARLSGVPHHACERNQINNKEYMETLGTPPSRGTPGTRGTPLPCEQALSCSLTLINESFVLLQEQIDNRNAKGFAVVWETNGWFSE